MSIEVETSELKLELESPIFIIAENPEVKNNLFFLTLNKTLYKINARDLSLSEILKLPHSGVNLDKPLIFKISPLERFCVISEKHGTKGFVLDLERKEIALELERGKYYADYNAFSADFFEKDNEEHLVHATDWNRLDITNLHSRKLITERKSPEHTEPHYLDYFHSGVTISPNYEWVLDNGWVWHPWGYLMAWKLQDWLENVWESEDGASKFEITGAADFWDRPLCWIDNNTIAYWGVGEDGEEMENSVVIYDLKRRSEIKVIPGIRICKLFFDKNLFCYSDAVGLNIWNIESSSLIYSNKNILPRKFIKFGDQYLINDTRNRLVFLRTGNL